MPAFQVVILAGDGGSVRGTTSIKPPRMTTYRAVLADWDEPGRHGRLVNTLAHEMTHLIARHTGTDRDFAFVDSGFSHRPCKQIHLVSYKS